MPTPNSPVARADDIHADPAFAHQFDASAPVTGIATPALVRHQDSSPLDGLRCNVGRNEQMVRLFAGAALVTIAAAAPVPRGWRVGMAILGAAQLVTGSLRHCPVWQALGINTCSHRGA